MLAVVLEQVQLWAGLKLSIFWPQPPQCCDYRSVHATSTYREQVLEKKKCTSYNRKGQIGHLED